MAPLDADRPLLVVSANQHRAPKPAAGIAGVIKVSLALETDFYRATCTCAIHRRTVRGSASGSGVAEAAAGARNQPAPPLRISRVRIRRTNATHSGRSAHCRGDATCSPPLWPRHSVGCRLGAHARAWSNWLIVPQLVSAHPKPHWRPCLTAGSGSALTSSTGRLGVNPRIRR